MIDHTVTLREWYDFYLVSMSVSQGNFFACRAQVSLVLLFFLTVFWGCFSPKPQRRENKNYKHLCLAFVIVFWLNTLHWLA